MDRLRDRRKKSYDETNFLTLVLASALVFTACGSKKPSESANDSHFTETEAEEDVTDQKATDSAANEAANSENNAGGEPASDVIRPEIKEAIDSYERFIDEYVAFVENYDASDLTMLAEYADFMSKYAEYSEKMDSLDDQELTDAEEAYYTEVLLRTSQKTLNAAAALD